MLGMCRSTSDRSVNTDSPAVWGTEGLAIWLKNLLWLFSVPTFLFFLFLSLVCSTQKYLEGNLTEVKQLEKMAGILHLENEFHLWVSTHIHKSIQKHTHKHRSMHTHKLTVIPQTCVSDHTYVLRGTKHTHTDMHTQKEKHANIHTYRQKCSHIDIHTNTHTLTLSLSRLVYHPDQDISEFIPPHNHSPHHGQTDYRLRRLLLFSTATRALIIEKPLGPPARSQRAGNDRTHLWGENKDNDTRRWYFHA